MISGYTVRVDPGRVGRSVDALVDVRLLPSTDPERFERSGWLAETQKALRLQGFLP